MSGQFDDETAWFPQKQTMEHGASNKSASRLSSADDGHEHDPIFSLGNADMGALNRYLHGGRVLPLNTDAFKNQAGIVNTTGMTDAVWAKIDELIEAYKTVHADCTGFLGDDDSAVKKWTVGQKAPKFKIPTPADDNNDDDDGDFDKMCTWDKLNALAQKICSYSDDAGSETLDGSYYVRMIQLCGDYNDAVKAGDDEKKNSTRADIKDFTDALLSVIGTIQSRLAKVKGALQTFDEKSQTNQNTLEGLETSMTAILDQEMGSIAALQKKIEQNQIDVKKFQDRIDEDRYDQKMTAAYAWIPVAGTIAAPVVFYQRQQDIDEYMGRLEDLNNIIQDEEHTLQLHRTLQGTVTSMKGQATDLSDLIGPAMTTVEELEGGWDFMATQITTISDKVDNFEDHIPGITLSKTQLQSIADSWVKLNKYVISYIESAQIVAPVHVLDIETYMQQLKKANSS